MSWRWTPSGLTRTRVRSVDGMTTYCGVDPVGPYGTAASPSGVATSSSGVLGVVRRRGRFERGRGGGIGHGRLGVVTGRPQRVATHEQDGRRVRIDGRIEDGRREVGPDPQRDAEQGGRPIGLAGRRAPRSPDSSIAAGRAAGRDVRRAAVSASSSHRPGADGSAEAAAIPAAVAGNGPAAARRRSSRRRSSRTSPFAQARVAAVVAEQGRGRRRRLGRIGRPDGRARHPARTAHRACRRPRSSPGSRAGAPRPAGRGRRPIPRR